MYRPYMFRKGDAAQNGVNDRGIFGQSCPGGIALGVLYGITIAIYSIAQVADCDGIGVDMRSFALLINDGKPETFACAVVVGQGVPKLTATDGHGDV